MADESTEIEQSVVVAASPAEVFAFVSDVGSMPSYLPTTTVAESTGPDTVRVAGQAALRDVVQERAAGAGPGA